MADAMLRALFTNFIGGGGAVSSHSYDTFPTDDDVTATTSTTDNSLAGTTWAILVASVGAADVWSYGAHVTNISAAMDAKFLLATGASSSEATFAAWPVTRIDLGTAATHIEPNNDWQFPFAVRIPSGTRLAGNFRAGGTTAHTAEMVGTHIAGLAG
jgi:hypothetical protein